MESCHITGIGFLVQKIYVDFVICGKIICGGNKSYYKLWTVKSLVCAT